MQKRAYDSSYGCHKLLKKHIIFSAQQSTIFSSFVVHSWTALHILHYNTEINRRRFCKGVYWKRLKTMFRKALSQNASAGRTFEGTFTKCHGWEAALKEFFSERLGLEVALEALFGKASDFFFLWSFWGFPQKSPPNWWGFEAFLQIASKLIDVQKKIALKLEANWSV